jgi:hypothetical protein
VKSRGAARLIGHRAIGLVALSLGAARGSSRVSDVHT